MLLDPMTGQATSTQKHGVSLDTHRFMMVKAKEENHHVLVAVPKKSESSVKTVGGVLSGEQPLFYT
jgi:microcompartment protein CcmK/EutM